MQKIYTIISCQGYDITIDLSLVNEESSTTMCIVSPRAFIQILPYFLVFSNDVGDWRENDGYPGSFHLNEDRTEYLMNILSRNEIWIGFLVRTVGFHLLFY